MTNSYKSVCYKCEKRAAGCGATCEAYKAERAARMADYEKKKFKAQMTSAEIEIHKAKARRNK